MTIVGLRSNQMNRREFIKNLISSYIAASISLDIEDILVKTTKLNDKDFVYFVTYMFELHISNPGKCFIIGGIN